jgi:hypothetical protein
MRSIAMVRISLFAFAACAFLSFEPHATAADPTALALSSPNGNLVTVDLITGVYTSIGGAVPGALGEIGGNLYASAETSLPDLAVIGVSTRRSASQ